MNTEWGETFKTWAQGPGKTEQEKCDNAESAIKKLFQHIPDLLEWTFLYLPKAPTVLVRTSDLIVMLIFVFA